MEERAKTLRGNYFTPLDHKIEKDADEREENTKPKKVL